MDTVTKYDIEVIKEEARNLVRKGCLSRQQPIYTLCKYIPDHYWIQFEQELEKNEYLLRDRIIDLLGCERWEEDGNGTEDLVSNYNNTKTTKNTQKI